MQPTQAPGLPLTAGIKGITIDPAQLENHVLRPPNVLGVSSYAGEGAGLFGHSRGAGKHLDVPAFGAAIHAALKDSVTGYVMQLQQNGDVIQTLQWNWAQTPADGGLGWNPDRPMHVASVSKLITAIAMTRLLDERHISVDSPIVNHLPNYWFKGPHIDKITFRHLMTHTTGFVTAGSATDFETMRLMVMLGVSTDPGAPAHLGGYRYENMNFGLCRILISIINGNIDKNALISDKAWDLVTCTAYSLYVATHVFAAANVTSASLTHGDGMALAYFFPITGHGWNSGNLLTVSGGAGWHMSVRDLLKVMSAFRRGGTIVSAEKAQETLDSGFGIDVISPTAAGTLYNKNGLWTDGSRVEQALAYFLPNNVELALFANSNVAFPAKFFRGVVSDIYEGNLK